MPLDPGRHPAHPAGLHRLTVALSGRLSLRLMAAVALGITGATAAEAGAAAVPATQRLVVLGTAHKVFARPDHRARRLASVDERRPITAARTTLPVLGSVVGADGRRWLHVMLPGRPNGHSGWISPSNTTTMISSWRLRIDTSRRSVTVYRSGRAVRTFRAVVGAASTPTPRGSFFVEESVRLPSSRVGAPFALALSARSNVLQTFDGGPGQIALHGMGNVGGVVGTAASHGCLRLERRPISWLAARIGPGVPVTITR